MRYIYADEHNTFYLGRVGENDAACAVIPVQGWVATYGVGTFTLIHRRPGEAQPYPCLVTYDSGHEELHWIVSSGDLAISGEGRLEINYTVGGLIAKSCIYETWIRPALDSSATAPDPWTSWVQSVINAKNDAVAAKTAIENMQVEAQTLPTGSAATVTKTTVEGVTKLTFGLPRGQKGDDGDDGEDGNGIASAVLNADYTLTLNFTDGTSYTTTSIRGAQGPAGPQGSPGQTGPQGPQGETGPQGPAGNTLFATFSVNFTTGHLIETTPVGFSGIDFSLNNGHMEVHING